MNEQNRYKNTRSRTFDFEIALAKKVKGIDEEGYMTEVIEVTNEILVNKLDVYSTEYWKAKQAGIELTNTFEAHSLDYSGEELLFFESELYKIERTYESGEYIELICRKESDTHEPRN